MIASKVAGFLPVSRLFHLFRGRGKKDSMQENVLYISQCPFFSVFEVIMPARTLLLLVRVDFPSIELQSEGCCS
ncbi:MAG: hypothetical protein LJE75_04630 [Gammaproteobacteria bacterium]|nr:hypothetical protein [Gammaproteobacteria bacterium]